VQPTVSEYDITQLHENTYYNVCVMVELTTRSVADDDDADSDRSLAATADVWNNYDGSETPLGDARMHHQSAAGTALPSFACSINAKCDYAILVADRPEFGRRPTASWNLAYHLAR